MPNDMLFSSPELEVIYQPGALDKLLVTFSALDFNQKTDEFWGRSLAEKIGMPSLGFVAKRNHWYPPRLMSEALPIARSITSQFQSVVTYGSSMGAYAAVKYSQALGAHACLGFGPQYSIDPRDGVSLPAYTRYHDQSLHTGMVIKEEDVCGLPYIFFDPLHQFDTLSADRIKSAAKHAMLLPLPHTGHECVKVVAGSKSVSDVIRIALSGNIEELRLYMARLRRRSSNRIAGLASAQLLARPVSAHAIFENYRERLDRKQIGLFYEAASLASERSGDWLAAEKFARLAHQQMPKRLHSLKRLGVVLDRQEKYAGALECYDKYLSFQPDDAGIHNAVAGIHMAREDPELALHHARLASDLAPTNSRIIRRLGQIELRYGDEGRAVETLERALRLDPTDKVAQRELMAARK